MTLLQVFMKKRYLLGFLTGGSKIAMAVISHSWLLFIHAVYNIINASAIYCANRDTKGRFSTMFHTGLLVVVASTIYLIYSIYIYFFGCTASYHMYIAIGIAAVTTYELITTVHGLKKAKRAQNIKQETLKYINLASALISISLTQTAILSFTNEGLDIAKIYAVGDAIFGIFALFVGVWMLIRSNQLARVCNQLFIVFTYTK